MLTFSLPNPFWGVAGPQVVPADRQIGPVGVLAGELVGEDPDAARLGQGVLLAVEYLPEALTRA